MAWGALFVVLGHNLAEHCAVGGAGNSTNIGYFREFRFVGVSTPRRLVWVVVVVVVLAWVHHFCPKAR